MAVHTEFTPADFAKILSDYDLGEFQGAKAFEEGKVQTNLKIETSRGRYAFRYYESRLRESAIFETELLHFLDAQRYPSPAPVRNRRGAFVGDFRGKPFAIFTFLEGAQVPNPNHRPQTPHSEAIARAIAELHLATTDFVPPHAETREGREPQDCIITAERNAAKISERKIRDERLQRLRTELEHIELPVTLPRAICHADVHHSNILFRGDRLTAVLDFDDACLAPMINDIANIIFWWACSPGLGVEFDKVRKILAAYQSVRPFEDIERIHIFDALKMQTLMSMAWFIDNEDDFKGDVAGIEELNAMGREGFLTGTQQRRPRP